MKMKHLAKGHLASLLTITLLGCTAAVNAQALGDTYSYFYGSNVQGGGYNYTSGLPADFNAYQVRNGTAGATVIDDGTNRALAPNLVGNPGNSQVWILGSGIGKNNDGANGLTESVTSVTLYLYASALSPNGSTNTFNIYSGLTGNDGNVVGSFSITDPINEGTFVGISIPLSVALAGFSIGSTNAEASQDSFQASTETHATASQHPGFAVSTVMVPEPSAALLGALGSLGVLRRRRNA